MRCLSVAACREVDRRAIAMGLPGIVLMENAARGATDVLRGVCEDGPTLVLCGPGNNGGDGWAMARHLVNGGGEVVIVALGESRSGTDAATNAAVTRAMGVPVVTPDAAPWDSAPALVDALFGTGLARGLEGAAADLVERANAAPGMRFAVDVPSGLDAERGVPLGPTVRAAHTATFVAAKPGLLLEATRPYVGTLHVVGIGVPSALIDAAETAIG